MESGPSLRGRGGPVKLEKPGVNAPAPQRSKEKIFGALTLFEERIRRNGAEAILLTEPRELT
jgi:hypothetical protein